MMFSWLSSYFRDQTIRNDLQELMKRLAHLQIDGTVRVGQARATGGYADVYDGTIRMKGGNETMKVAIKKCRVIVEEEDKFAKRFERELLIWGRLKHKNVLPLLGITTIDGFPCMVSVWMVNGTMSKYLKSHTDVNLLELVQGIADGLGFLHLHEVIHSDLKSQNVLISEDRRAILADFGTSRLLLNGITIAGTQTLIGNARWSAPELLQTTKVPTSAGHLFHTEASDTWAFGMVVYEALRREVPFYDWPNEGQVMSLVTRGELPSKPDGAGLEADDLELLWDCCQRCWNYEPERRPSMRAIREQLKCKDVLLIEDMRLVPASCLWMSQTGRFLAIRSYGEMSITFLETRTMGECGPGLSILSFIWEVAWSNTEDHIVILSKDGMLQKWSNVLRTPMVVARSTQIFDGCRLEFSPDDRLIACFMSKSRLLDASNLSVIWEHPGDWPYVAFHPFGSRVIFSLGSVLDTDIRYLRNITATHHNLDFFVYGLVFGPSENICVASTFEGVKILSGDKFEEMTSLPYRHCKAMQFTPDGKYILFVLESKVVVLWDIDASEAVEELSLSMVLESAVHWKAKISRDCCVIQLSARGTWATNILHLTSSYY